MVGYINLQTSCRTKERFFRLYLIDDFSDKYEIFLVMGNFNSQADNELLRNVKEINGPSNLIKGNTCYRGRESCNDLVLTNRTYLLKISCSFETGLSDHCPLIYIRLKTTFIIQRQASKDVYKKRCSENMLQIYRRKPMPKCDFNKVANEILANASINSQFYYATSIWMFYWENTDCKFNHRPLKVVFHCIKHARIQYKDFVLTRENTGQWKRVFSHILCSVYHLWKIIWWTVFIELYFNWPKAFAFLGYYTLQVFDKSKSSF